VCFDCFSLCLKAGSACILKGGRDAEQTCRAIVSLIRRVLQRHSLPQETVLLLTTHEATDQLLQARGLVDLIIPRGSQRLIEYVRTRARVPIIETGAGVVHCYVDRAADLEKARAIVLNAKTRRVSVCNALDCLIIHQSRLADLPQLVLPLLEHSPAVELLADEQAYAALESSPLITPYSSLVNPHSSLSYDTEFMDYKLAIKTVASLDEALDHIDRYGSGHSEAIITSDEQAARRFQQHVDAACVYWNVPTSFTDGAQFGLGAEIGISTQKLGPRGPMALEEITTYKWLIEGEGQTRQ
jgi:glutamate-5-semialdehyde dehydrogenase